MTEQFYEPKAIRKLNKKLEKNKGIDLTDNSLIVAIYTRVSSPMQLSGFSLDYQKDACEKFAKSKGWKEENFLYYCDPAKSGRDDKRPDFQKMIADAKNGKFNVLVVHKLDRFMRNMYLCSEYIKILMDNNVAIFFFGDGLDFSIDEIGGIKYWMFAWFADYYSQNLSKESKKGLQRNFEEGRQSGFPAWGYIKLDNSHDCIVDETKREIVTEIFQKFATGEYSYADLSRLMNEKGFVTYYGKPFVSRDLSRIIHTPFYAGYVVHHENIQKGIHEPIISQELFETCQEVADIKGAQYAKRNKNDLGRIEDRYMLHKLLVCTECGKRIPLWTQKKKETDKIYTYYSECNCRQSPPCRHRIKKVPSSIPEEQITRIISGIKLPNEWVSSAIAEKNDDFFAYDNEIKRMESRLTTLKDKALSPETSDDDLISINQERKALYRKIKKMKDERKDPTEQLDKFHLLLSSFATCFANATMPEKAEICHLLFENIYFDIENQKVVAFTPDPDFQLLFELIAEDNQWAIEKDENQTKFILP